MEYYSGEKKPPSHKKTQRNLKKHGEKPIWKGYKRYHYSYMTFWKRQNYETLKRLVVARDSGGGREE